MDFRYKIREIDPLEPFVDSITEAALVIRTGGVVVFPTSCLYGLGADAFNQSALDRLFDIKKRPLKKPVLILIAEPADIEYLVKSVPTVAQKIMDIHWPGNVTIVFEAKDTLPDSLTAGTGKIGVRLPGHPVASALVKMVGNPITGTSANISGRPACKTISELDPEIGDEAELILDAGTLKGGVGSTVVDITGDFPRIIREGVIPANMLLKRKSEFTEFEMELGLYTSSV